MANEPYNEVVMKAAAVLIAGAATGATAAGQATLLASIGSPSDAAYTGTGDGTVISLLKGIYANGLLP